MTDFETSPLIYNKHISLKLRARNNKFLNNDEILNIVGLLFSILGKGKVLYIRTHLNDFYHFDEKLFENFAEIILVPSTDGQQPQMIAFSFKPFIISDDVKSWTYDWATDTVYFGNEKDLGIFKLVI